MKKDQQKQTEVQRKLEYFRNLKAQAFQNKKPVFTAPKFQNVARRSGMRGK